MVSLSRAAHRVMLDLRFVVIVGGSIMRKQSPCALALAAVVATWHVAHAEDDVQPTASGTRLVLNAHEKGARFAVYAPDGRTLATGGTDQSVRLWDVATGKEKGVLGRHESA